MRTKIHTNNTGIDDIKANQMFADYALLGPDMPPAVYHVAIQGGAVLWCSRDPETMGARRGKANLVMEIEAEPSDLIAEIANDFHDNMAAGRTPEWEKTCHYLEMAYKAGVAATQEEPELEPWECLTHEQAIREIARNRWLLAQVREDDPRLLEAKRMVQQAIREMDAQLNPDA